jgi:gas vesicle protein
MQVLELYQLSKWIDEEIVERKLVALYDALFQVLNFNATRPGNQPTRPFEDEKARLYESLQSINMNVLSLSQIEALDTLGIRQNIGVDGKEKVESLLRNTLDIAHVANGIQAIQQEINGGIEKANLVKKSLSIFIDTEKLELEENKVLTRIIFDHEAAISDIDKLKEWSSRLFDIGRGFAVANGQTPQDIQVVGAAHGSIIVELAILATTALPIAKAINLILDSMVKYRDFQLKSAEVRDMKKDNPKLADEFEEEAKRWEDRASRLKKEIAEDIANEIKPHFSNYKEENQAELARAVKYLVDFVSKGGDVDCLIPEEDLNEEEVENGGQMAETMKSLRQDFARIRKLKETALLEHHELLVDDDEE